MSLTFVDELRLLIRARYPVIYISTIEEDRVEYTIKRCLKNQEQQTIYSWDFVEGFTANPNINGFAARNPAQALDLIEKINLKKSTIFVLKDFNKFLSDTAIVRKIKNLIRLTKLQPKTIIIVANEITIPPELTNFFTLLEFTLPSYNEIRDEINRLFLYLKETPDNEFVEKLTRVSQGLTLEKIRQTLSKSLAKNNRINENTIDLILREKSQLISQTQYLDLPEVNNKLSDIGGLKNLKRWLKTRKYAFSEKAELYGLPTPRGLLLAGVQGTGKSLTAKAIAGEWQLPLIRLDTGRLFEGVIGESEKNVTQMIKVVEATAPCILWIDEIDKAFADKTMTNDSGTTTRVISRLITWLSEKTTAVFVVATANNIYALPLEIIRKGRFDEIFFVNLPTFKERHEIFKIFLKRIRPSTRHSFNLQLLSQISEGFAGAEIEQAIIDAMYNAFHERRDFTEADIAQSLQQIIPLSKSDPTRIKTLLEWVESGRFRLA